MSDLDSGTEDLNTEDVAQEQVSGDVEAKAKKAKKLSTAEKIDRVVESTNSSLDNLGGRVSGLEDGIGEIKNLLQGLTMPATFNKFKDFDDGAEQSGTAAFGDSGELVHTTNTDVNSPLFKAEVDHERFMNETVEVYINESNDPNDEDVFRIGVNGEHQYFQRDRTSTVKRKFIEGLARCRPINFKNEEYSDASGARAFRHKSSRATRYPFAIVEDTNPAGRQWLRNLRKEA